MNEKSTGKDMGIVATVASAVAVIHLGFPETSSSGFIMKTAFDSAGVKYTLEEIRMHTEKYERSRGIGKGSYKIKAGASMSGSADIEIEKKPVWEMKTIIDLKYMREGST